MFWDLVGTVFSGLGAAGIALLLRALSRKRLPVWLAPVFAGIGMMAYQVYGEYTWFDHKQSLLPAGSVVLETHDVKIPWRPWSYLFPQTLEFTVLDQANLRRIEQDDQQIVEMVIYRFERRTYDRVGIEPQLLNCLTGDLVPLTEQGQPRLELATRIELNSRLAQLTCR